MKELIETRFFGLVTKCSNNDNRSEVISAYDEFIDTLIFLSNGDVSLPELIRTIDFTRIELSTLQRNTRFNFRAGKKCKKQFYLQSPLAA